MRRKNQGVASSDTCFGGLTDGTKKKWLQWRKKYHKWQGGNYIVMVLGTTQNNFGFFKCRHEVIKWVGRSILFIFLHIWMWSLCWLTKIIKHGKNYEKKVRFFRCSNLFSQVHNGFPRTRNSDTCVGYLESSNPIFRVHGTIIRGNTRMVTLDFIFETYLILMGHFLERVYSFSPEYNDLFSF